MDANALLWAEKFITQLRSTNKMCICWLHTFLWSHKDGITKCERCPCLFIEALGSNLFIDSWRACQKLQIKPFGVGAFAKVCIQNAVDDTRFHFAAELLRVLNFWFYAETCQGGCWKAAGVTAARNPLDETRSFLSLLLTSVKSALQWNVNNSTSWKHTKENDAIKFTSSRRAAAGFFSCGFTSR